MRGVSVETAVMSWPNCRSLAKRDMLFFSVDGRSQSYLSVYIGLFPNKPSLIFMSEKLLASSGGYGFV